MPETEFIEKVAEAPAKVLEKTVEASEKISEKVGEAFRVKKVKGFWHKLGHGLTTGAADDDPSGIVTYSQVGARFGLQMLWTAPFLYVLMATIQEMCARIGIVTGRGLAGNIRKHFSKKILITLTALLFFANTLNIGADIGAMAKVTQLLVPQLGFGFLVVGITIFSMLLQIYLPYKKYAAFLKYLTLILFSYILVAFMVALDWRAVLHASIFPTVLFNKEFLLLFCAICGTTISPYLFFWQTSQEVEDKVSKDVHPRDIRKMRLDVWVGMFISNTVMFFIITTTSATLHRAGIFNIQTAEQAAQALRPLAGDFAYLLFAIGIIGTGFLAIPVLAGGVSYAFAESYLWKEGLNRKLKDAYAFYGVLIIAMVVGLLINFIGIDPIHALIYYAVINGLLAPIIIVFVILISSNKEVMGKYVNNTIQKIIGWGVFGLMSLAGIGAIVVSLI